MSVHKVRDTSAETKEELEAVEGAVKNDGKLTFSRVLKWEVFV